MLKLRFILLAIFLLFCILAAQQSTTPPTNQPKTTAYSAIPVEAARQANPVKPGPESIARAKKWWTIDCVMCHGADGNGKGDTAKEMKLSIVDLTDPNTLKDRTDGEIFYIINKGHQDMPPEGQRVKTEENWDLVNYVRSLAKKTAVDQKPQS